MSGKAEEMEVFTKVYDSGNLSAAAHLTGLTPSGVSRLMKRLESRLGTTLFYRNSRSLRPTPEGEVFYRRCIDALKAIEIAEAAIATDMAANTTLRVNTLPSFAKYQLAPAIPAFHARHPNIRIEFVLGAQPTDPTGQRIDVAIYSGRQRDSSMVARRLASARWLLVAAPQYLAKHGTPRHPSELNQHQCLNFAIPTPWNTWRFSTPDYPKVTPPAIMGADQGDMLMAMALAGLGIARLADFHVSQALRDGQLVTVLEDLLDEPDEPIYVLYRGTEQISARVEAWLDFVRETFGGTPPWRMD